LFKICVGLNTLSDNLLESMFGFKRNMKNTFESEIKRIEKEVFIKQNPPRWRAGKGERCYYASICGTAESYIDYHGEFDNNLYASGNYFETRELAEAMAAKWRELFSGGGEK